MTVFEAYGDSTEWFEVEGGWTNIYLFLAVALGMVLWTLLSSQTGVGTRSGMRLSHVTLRDPTLPHQVVFSVGSSSTAGVHISCNCRAVVNHQGNVTYDTIGPTKDLDESRRLYNDPVNHRKPFSKEDEALW